MRRRAIHFVAACAWLPFVPIVRSQRASPPVVGFLSSRSPEEAAPHLAAFRRGLAEQGFEDSGSVTIEERWARGHYDRLSAQAKELLGRHVDVLVAVGGLPAALAAKEATQTVPIVFLEGDDPIEAGLVTRMNRPSGNLTGVTFITSQLNGKRLALLCEGVPDKALVAFLLNPHNPGSVASQHDVEHAAKTLGHPLLVLRSTAGQNLADAFAAMAANRARALVVQNDPYFDSQRDQVVALAAQHRVPAIYHIREFPAGGGLMSYGASLLDAYRDVGVYAGRILQGARPSELPVLRPTRFEFVINARVARELGLKLPPRLLVMADEVLQ
ncbi:MAG TPA: ABC transporter substrate-binding protein [Burkholderiaceae bacterium]|nr:ABC transporter substrate-binding protein [Burkholderiaceae bacterium]